MNFPGVTTGAFDRQDRHDLLVKGDRLLVIDRDDRDRVRGREENNCQRDEIHPQFGGSVWVPPYAVNPLMLA